MKQSKLLSRLMALTGNAIFGLSFLFSKRAMEVAEPFVLLAVRFLVAFGLMSLLRLTGKMPCRLKGKNITPLVVLGLFQPVLYFICESYGIKHASTSIAGILISLIPIAGLVLAAVLLRERPNLGQILFSVLSVLGVVVLTTADDGGGFEPFGLLCLLGAVVTGSMFHVQSRRIADRFTSFERTYVMFGVGTAAFVLLAALQVGTDWERWLTPLRSGSFRLSIGYLSCISSVAAFLMLNKALDVLPVAESLVFANITTVISVLAGIFLLKEQFSAVQAVGIVMTIVGVYGVNRRSESEVSSD